VNLDRLAHHLGRGLVASVAGTAAMTVSSTVEMRLRGRDPSDAPGRAAARLLRVRIKDDPATGRLARLGHVMTGVSLGSARGLVGFAGLREPVASGVFLGVSLLPDAAGLSAMGIAPPPWRWSATEVAVSVGHHAVFTLATGAAYAALERLGQPSTPVASCGAPTGLDSGEPRWRR
jgi:hypothetical protein